jgi:hypothetical protein
VSRRPLDVYETPRALSLAVCHWLKSKISEPKGAIWEPSSGTGSFVAAARATWPTTPIVAFDVRKEVDADARENGADNFVGLDWVDDWGHPGSDWEQARPWLVVGNPPFKGCELHLVRALERVELGGYVCFLLSLNLFWPSRAREMLWDLPGLVRVQPMNPRPDFLGRGGSDAVGCAAYLWQRGYTGPTMLHKPLRWRGDIARTQTELEIGGGQ